MERSRDQGERFDDAKGLTVALRELGVVTPPPSLVPGVLVGTGLADGYWPEETAIGRVFVAYGAAGVVAVQHEEAASAFDAWFRGRFGRRAVAAPPRATLARSVRARLAGERAAPPPFDLRAVRPFQRAVLEAAATIPRGEVRPYAWIAREIGRPGAVRAVGTALAHNPVPLLMPCHRVVRADGRLGEYVFGTGAKRALLTAEGVDIAGIEQRGRTGQPLSGSDTTRIFCYPTCRHARRTMPEHLVRFASAPVARAAGYRPCLVCRPVEAG